MKERAQIWSSGGGTQSAAIAALIVTGRIAPPDLAIIVDTERELETTWQYHDEVIVPALKKVGVTLHRVPKSDFATVDLYSGEGDLLIPVFTDHSGGMGKLPTFCSNEWKTRVAQRWARQQLPGVKNFDVWLGISTDELKRVRQPIGKWQNRYPLIDQRMNRGDCIALVRRVGWPEPPRSSCKMCPNHTHDEWIRIKVNSPRDFDEAVDFEREMRKSDDSLFLHPSGMPLDQIEPDVGAADLFTGRCDSGYCFT
jgi:hypothetical protein